MGGAGRRCHPRLDLVADERHRWGVARSGVGVARLLYKWTNYGEGWWSRLFTLCGGVLSYSKFRSLKQMVLDEEGVR